MLRAPVVRLGKWCWRERSVRLVYPRSYQLEVTRSQRDAETITSLIKLIFNLHRPLFKLLWYLMICWKNPS